MNYDNENDFKYVLQEVSRTTIGARFTYAELLDQEHVPFKFRLILERLILPYADSNLTVGEHLLSLSPGDPNYRIYRQLKTKIKYFVPKKSGGYEERISGIDDLQKAVGLSEDDPPPVIQEIILSNLALMGIHL